MKSVELITKLSKYFVFLLGIVVFVYMGLIMTGDVNTQISEDGIKTFSGSVISYTDQLYIILLLVLAIAVLLALGFSLFQGFSSVRKVINVSIVFVLAGVIFLVAYLLSDGTPVKFISGDYSGEVESKWSEVGIIYLYILFSVAVLVSFLLGPIARLIKK